MQRLSWGDIDNLCEELCRKIDVTCFDSVYGIPRGGAVIAIILSHKLNLEYVVAPRDVRTLVVDDICETGHTLREYKDHYACATLHYVPTADIQPDWWVEEKKEWILYPWETESTSKMDYAEN